MSRRLKECVAEPIVQRLNIWRKEGKEYLFAGVAAGNETKVPDFSRGYEGYSGAAGEEAGMDMTKFPHPHPVKAILDSFQQKVEPLVKNGKFSEAEAFIDSTISRLQALKNGNI